MEEVGRGCDWEGGGWDVGESACATEGEVLSDSTAIRRLIVSKRGKLNGDGVMAHYGLRFLVNDFSIQGLSIYNDEFSQHAASYLIPLLKSIHRTKP